MARCSRASRLIPRMTDSRKPWVRRAVVTKALRYGGGESKRAGGRKDTTSAARRTCDVSPYNSDRGQQSLSLKISSRPPARPPGPNVAANPAHDSPASFPSFVDLHNHLVPGVDDGAATVAEAVDALRSLYAEGVRTLVATPHLLLPHLATDGAIGRALDTAAPRLRPPRRSRRARARPAGPRARPGDLGARRGHHPAGRGADRHRPGRLPHHAGGIRLRAPRHARRSDRGRARGRAAGS